MGRRLLTILALSSGLAFPSMLEGASSRVELAGGWPRQAGPTVAVASPAPVRPLAPGEVLVLGPTASPLTAPASAPEPATSAIRPAAPSPAVDTVTVSAPPAAAPAPSGTIRSAAPGAVWENYRTGNVVRIALPKS